MAHNGSCSEMEPKDVIIEKKKRGVGGLQRHLYV